MASCSTNSMNKRKKLLSVQAEALVAAIEADSTLVRHPFTGPSGQNLKKALWGAVAKDLNKLGPAKTWGQWRQTWKDMKAKTRKLVAVKAKEKQMNPLAFIQIPPLERRVLTIILAKEDGSASNQITLSLPENKPENSMEYFENSDDDMCYRIESNAGRVANNDDSNASGDSDVPLRNSRTRKDVSSSNSRMEDLLAENTRQLREMVAISRQTAEAVRELTEVTRNVGECTRDMTQALYEISAAARSFSSPGVVLGGMNEDYGEGRS